MMNNSKKHDQAVKSIVYHFHRQYVGLMRLGVWPQWPLDYEPVALVLEADLEEVFRLTQGIELSSDDDAMVRWFDANCLNRSTIIGDVIVVDDGKELSTWRCASDCWELFCLSYNGQKHPTTPPCLHILCRQGIFCFAVRLLLNKNTKMPEVKRNGSTIGLESVWRKPPSVIRLSPSLSACSCGR